MGDEDDDDDGGGGRGETSEKKIPVNDTVTGTVNNSDTENGENVSNMMEDEEFIEQINTINIKFPYNRWLKREEIKEMIYQQIGHGCLSSIYDKVSFWRIKFKTQEHFNEVMAKGIDYQYQDKKYNTKPEEVFSNATGGAVNAIFWQDMPCDHHKKNHRTTAGGKLTMAWSASWH